MKRLTLRDIRIWFLIGLAAAGVWSAQAQTSRKWHEVSRDKDSIIGIDVSVNAPSSRPGGGLQRRFMVGFASSRSFPETEKLLGHTSDFVLLNVNVYCSERHITYVAATGMTVQGSGRGELNKFLGDFSGLETQLPPSAKQAMLAGACDDRVSPAGFAYAQQLVEALRNSGRD
jgi:hypothetical protein